MSFFLHQKLFEDVGGEVTPPPPSPFVLMLSYQPPLPPSGMG